MLVLTRRSGESVRIGADVRVVVISASGNQVRLGIEAPAQVPIHREEVFDRIARANRDAAEIPDDVLAAIGTPAEGAPERGEGGDR